MLYSSHKWISISCNLNSKGYIRIVQNSVFIRKNPGEQRILVPRKLLLLHICDCNRLRAKIDGLSAHQVPWRLWKSRAWITYFTFWTSTGTNIKQKQQKKKKKSTHSLCEVQCLQPLASFSQCLWQCCRAPGPEGTPNSSSGSQQEHEKCRFLLQCRFPEWSSVIYFISLCINSLL